MVRRVHHFLPFKYRKMEKYQKIQVSLTIIARSSLQFRLSVVMFNIFVHVKDSHKIKKSHKLDQCKVSYNYKFFYECVTQKITPIR